jgi:hypothetical protein
MEPPYGISATLMKLSMVAIAIIIAPSTNIFTFLLDALSILIPPDQIIVGQ